MKFTHEQKADYLVLQPTGRLDISNSQDFETEFQAVLDKGYTRIVIDMSQVEYVSSAGLRCILVAAKKIQAVNGDIRFSHLNDMVDEVFTISGFRKIFAIFESSDLAASE
ncbi:MAG: STAS domain-containing protein [Desulfobulbaceae bacterium]|nr:STAS domain-containing protein [Desulfobulbaceae bacterium]